MSRLIETIAAIDVHAHFGRYRGAPLEILNQFMSGSAEVVLQRARVDAARLSPRAKQMILRENVLRVLPRLKKYASAL